MEVTRAMILSASIFAGFLSVAMATYWLTIEAYDAYDEPPVEILRVTQRPTKIPIPKQEL